MAYMCSEKIKANSKLKQKRLEKANKKLWKHKKSFFVKA